MAKIEKAPVLDIPGTDLLDLLGLTIDDDIAQIIEKVEKEYLYWDKIKYLNPPNTLSKEELWYLIKFLRQRGQRRFRFNKLLFSFAKLSKFEKILHYFDLNYGGSLGASTGLSEADKQQYLVNSIAEESIASSQIEGAVTTRRIAKEMLLAERKPRDKSEQMIYNNFKTIQKIREIKDQPISDDLLLEIHRLVTKDTLENEKDEGQFRKTNDINVVDMSSSEVVHIPPSYKELKKWMKDLYSFFNDEKEEPFIHPIIKACIVHFMIGYVHPFTDGNGRTARALFYWYMLKKGYWLTEYLSISSAILKSRNQYYKAFQYVEIDDNDLTYFVHYHIKTLQKSYDELQKYLKRKVEEKREAIEFLKSGVVNERQAKIIQIFQKNPDKLLTVKEVETTYGISNQTARVDIMGLVDMKLLSVVKQNKVKQAFIRSVNFDERLRKLTKK